MTFSAAQREPGGAPLFEPPGGAGEQNAGQAPVSSGVQLWATRVLFGYFVARLIFFALSISSFVPPDEVTQAGLCQVFSKVLLLPANTPETYQFGLVTNTPWLYPWTMGKLLHLNLFGLPDLVFLRLLNIPLALGTVWYALRTLRLMSRDPLARLLLLVVLTNTAMFSLLSAAVSYDNLAILLSTMAIYYTLAFFRYRTGVLLGASLLCQLTGCLTKVTFLPLAAVLGALLAVFAVCQFRAFLAALRGYFGSGGRSWLQLLLILAAFGLNLQLYAGNMTQYGSLSPTPATVLSAGHALQYRIAERENIFSLYQSGQISYMEALQMAGEIRHVGDKSDTFYLLMSYENLKAHPSLWMGPRDYVKVWFVIMAGSVFGIKAHLPMYKSFSFMVPIYLVLALSLAGIVLRWRPRDGGWLAASLLAVAGFYTGVLLVKVNYPAYQYYGNPGIATQGRYLLIVFAPLCLLASLYLARLFRAERVRLGLVLATALLFLAYDFPWFLAHATPEWYSWLPH